MTTAVFRHPLHAALAACVLSWTPVHALSAGTADTGLPRILHADPAPGVMPLGLTGTTWVPVFVYSDDDRYSGPLAPDHGNGVLLGLAEVRTRGHDGSESVSVSPGVRWQLSESLQLGAGVTVTDFVPCRSLLSRPLAPVHSDPCESFDSQSAPGVGISASIGLGSGRLTAGVSDTPAIWVLPGTIASPGLTGSALRSPAVPMAPVVGALAQERARTVSLGGELDLDDQTRIGMALAMSRLPGLEQGLDIGRVQFSVGYGNFSADMATRMMRRGLESVSPWWAGVDLGVSWKTPWSGIISLGAHNIVTHGEPPSYADPALAPVSESDRFIRTPYVRYEQDF
jgi:hypothetical protein